MQPVLANARYSQSASSLAQLPADRGAEVAFVGRSNAGKSSAVNAITGHKGLARVSKTPGRTRAINVFVLDDRRRLIDLPGLGYARASHSTRERWAQLLGRYLQQRRCLRGLMLVMDVRHPLQPIERQLLQWCRENAVPVHVLLAKSDKLSPGANRSILKRVQGALAHLGADVSLQLFSAPKGEGVALARSTIAGWLDL